MAEDRTIARGQQSGNEETVLAGELRRMRRIHALVNRVQPTGTQRAVDRPPIEPRPLQLRAGDDPRLIPSDRANCSRSASVFEANPEQFGHQRMVDDPAAEKQDASVSSPLIARPNTSASGRPAAPRRDG
jgi:hypothetical protein